MGFRIPPGTIDHTFYEEILQFWLDLQDKLRSQKYTLYNQTISENRYIIIHKDPLFGAFHRKNDIMLVHNIINDDGELLDHTEI